MQSSGIADQHVLEVSDEVHTLVMELIAACAKQDVPVLPPPDPAQELSATRRRCMLDVSYMGSPLIGRAGRAAGTPAPGQRFPDRVRLRGTGHHLLVFGTAPRLDDFRKRWDQLVSIVDAGARFDAAKAGVPDGGVVLVRPDGFIGFRAAPADAASMQALDQHLSSYLVPTPLRS
jgi:hypothetical protein